MYGLHLVPTLRQRHLTWSESLYQTIWRILLEISLLATIALWRYVQMTPFLAFCDTSFNLREKERRTDECIPKYLCIFIVSIGVSPSFHFSDSAVCPPPRHTLTLQLSTFARRRRRFAVLRSTFNWFYRPRTVSETKITSSANKGMEMSIKSGISCI